jgi:hypothetical protein
LVSETIWFEADREFSEAELLEIYAARAGRKPSGGWLDTIVAQGVHRRTYHGRKGQQGGRSDATFAAPQLRLAEVIADSGVAMFASPHDRCEIVLRAWSWWGSGAIPTEQVRDAFATCSKRTKRPLGLGKVRGTGRDLADWFAGPNNSLSRSERKRLSDAHVGEVFGGLVEARNRDVFNEPAYGADLLRPAKCPRTARARLAAFCRKVEAACGPRWFGPPGLLRLYDAFDVGQRLENYSDVRLEQARVLYRFLIMVYDDVRPLLTFLRLPGGAPADWPRQHAYECLTLTLGVIAPIPTDVLAPLIARCGSQAAPDESWPAADRDTHTAAAPAAITTRPPRPVSELAGSAG